MLAEGNRTPELGSCPRHGPISSPRHGPGAGLVFSLATPSACLRTNPSSRVLSTNDAVETGGARLIEDAFRSEDLFLRLLA